MRRQQVLAIIAPEAVLGTMPSYREIARRCDPPLYDYRHARRIVRELTLFGLVDNYRPVTEPGAVG